jgi:hypothetical protein
MGHLLFGRANGVGRAFPRAAALICVLYVVAGCGKGDGNAAAQPTGAEIDAPPADDLSGGSRTISSPDGSWKVAARSGPTESFDLSGPSYSTTVAGAIALEFSPDSKLFVYKKHSRDYGRYFLFRFDTTLRQHTQVSDTNLPPPPLNADATKALIYGPEPPITWQGHVISWSVAGDSAYRFDLDEGRLINRSPLDAPTAAP